MNNYYIINSVIAIHESCIKKDDDSENMIIIIALHPNERPGKWPQYEYLKDCHKNEKIIHIEYGYMLFESIVSSISTVLNSGIIKVKIKNINKKDFTPKEGESRGKFCNFMHDNLI